MRRETNMSANLPCNRHVVRIITRLAEDRLLVPYWITIGGAIFVLSSAFRRNPSGLRFFLYFGWTTLCDLAAEIGRMFIILVGDVSEKSLFAPELRIFFDFADRPWRAFWDRFAKKVAFFCSKNLQGIKTCLIFASPNKKWWIHLRARIRASHARHRGSNPLSTTKETKNIRSANRTPLFFIHSEVVRAIHPPIKNRKKIGRNTVQSSKNPLRRDGELEGGPYSTKSNLISCQILPCKHIGSGSLSACEKFVNPAAHSSWLAPYGYRSV